MSDSHNSFINLHLTPPFHQLVFGGKNELERRQTQKYAITNTTYLFWRKVVSSNIKINSVKVTPTNVEETQTKRRKKGKNVAQNVRF